MPDKPEKTGGLTDATLSKIQGLITASSARNDTIDQLGNSQQALSAQVAELHRAITSLTTAPAAAPVVPTEPQAHNPLANILAGGQVAPAPQVPAAPAQAPTDIGALVAQAVQSAVAPLVEDISATKAVNAKREAQKASFAKAVQVVPTLTDPNSAESQVFQKIFDGHEGLQNLDDGPQLAAMIAAGITKDNTQQATQRTERKVAASVAPSRAPIAPPAAQYLGGEQGEYERSKELTNNLMEKGRDEGLTEAENTHFIGNLLAQGFTEQLNPEVVPQQ